MWRKETMTAPGGPVLKDPVEGKGSLEAEKEESERLEKTKR